MDTTLTGHEERLFEVWCFSPTVHSDDRDELILAWKIGLELHRPGSRVLKAMRQVAGVDPAIVDEVESFVASDPQLGWDESGERRKVVFLG